MAKKVKEADMNLYYMNHGQAQKGNREDEIKRKKAKEREKRIKQNKARKEDDFDFNTEIVMQMTNRNKIKKEEEKRKKIIREEKKRKKRIKRIKFFFKTMLLLGITIGGITFAMISPIFNIKDIQVLNNEQVSSEAVISLSELKKEENIFSFSKSKVIKKIKENAYIENIKVYRKVPNVVQIQVEERVHNYSVDFLGKYAYINSQGYILEIAEDSKQKIILHGIKTSEEQVVEKNRLNNEDLEKLEDVIKIMNAAKEYNLDSKITTIDIEDKNQYSIYLKEEGKRAYLGNNTNLTNKMLYINAIIEEEKGKEGEIFANGDLNNKFKVYFKESIKV